MLTWLRARGQIGRTATKLYGSVAAQARDPTFYATYGVPDTPEGRFDLLVVHLYLVLERLKGEREAGAALSRSLVETFITDMDDSMRELGLGDLSVPRKVKKAVAALYDRVHEYRAAMSEADGERLVEALTRNVYGSVTVAERAACGAQAIAAYMCIAATALAAQASAEVLAGRIVFPAASSGKGEER
ncbi:MAG TPA: ubiquinol-cytochrome C chaperone family protein [Hyphomicrobiaceae bacterium]|jgi:cytochrome b pre-mRNA-processing protein 3|nr:ubiquinol-cytochrome C chaperone family protein [Hyphomicrobiaceae bacterium]